MLRSILLASALVSTALAPAVAQDSKISRNSLAETLPAEVLAVVRSAQSVRTIYPITGNETFRGQVLKADEIVFAPGASLTLSSTDSPWIVIIAKRWKFADPTQFVEIKRASVTSAVGSDGSAGDRGADNPGETNRAGNPGFQGSSGSTGGMGGTSRLPTIYLVGDAFTSPSGDPLPGSLRLKLSFAGVNGGNGGSGGDGGDGGRGGNGKEGSTSMFDCQDGPGPGGSGGASGRGGQGGQGGRGGNGAGIVLISTPLGIEQLSYARIVNQEGFGGAGGRPGRAGHPGAGGRGANSHGYCGPSGPGYQGLYPEPADNGEGSNGSDGQKGAVTAVTVQSLSPVF